MAASPVDAEYLASLKHPRELESAVDRARRRLTVLPNGRTRAVTIPPRKLTRDESVIAEETSYPEDVDRPATRGACSQMARPCPFVSCAHHLFLDVNPKTGAIKLNYPNLEVWEMAESCSLDVADRGGVTLEEVGRIYNLTRERIRQVEVSGLAKLKDADDIGLPPERADYSNGYIGPKAACP